MFTLGINQIPIPANILIQFYCNAITKYIHFRLSNYRVFGVYQVKFVRALNPQQQPSVEIHQFWHLIEKQYNFIWGMGCSLSHSVINIEMDTSSCEVSVGLISGLLPSFCSKCYCFYTRFIKNIGPYKTCSNFFFKMRPSSIQVHRQCQQHFQLSFRLQTPLTLSLQLSLCDLLSALPFSTGFYHVWETENA